MNSQLLRWMRFSESYGDKSRPSFLSDNFKKIMNIISYLVPIFYPTLKWYHNGNIKYQKMVKVRYVYLYVFYIFSGTPPAILCWA